jgi:prepilin-type N-terminal cleavage/methylation domain-containing protein
MRDNKGFTIIEIVLVVAVIAIVGLIGWRVWDASNQTANTPATNTQQTQAEIKTTSDLDKATQTLDDTDVIGSSESELDAETDF